MEVNSWASLHTNSLIKDFLPLGSIHSLTNKTWENSFDKSMMQHQRLHLLNGESIRVPFMSSYERQYITAYNDFKVLKLPYLQSRDNTDRKFSMYFYLPDNLDGLDHLLERMASTNGFLDTHIPRDKVTTGQFKIHKFKIEFGFEATTVFPEFVALDVSLYQKALIEINEEGTEAAAATIALYGCAYVPPSELIDFVADRPFIFLIREDITGTILFAGQIFDPSKSSSP